MQRCLRRPVCLPLQAPPSTPQPQPRTRTAGGRFGSSSGNTSQPRASLSVSGEKKRLKVEATPALISTPIAPRRSVQSTTPDSNSVSPVSSSSMTTPPIKRAREETVDTEQEPAERANPAVGTGSTRPILPSHAVDLCSSTSVCVSSCVVACTRELPGGTLCGHWTVGKQVECSVLFPDSVFFVRIPCLVHIHSFRIVSPGSIEARSTNLVSLRPISTVNCRCLC